MAQRGTGAVHVTVRRVYEEPSPTDGYRVLVDRLWPRGLAKSAAALDEWCRDVAPSAELRRWYGHDPGRFEEFRARYLAELADPVHSAAIADVLGRASGRLTLLTAGKDLSLSHAGVLADHLAHRTT